MNECEEQLQQKEERQTHEYEEIGSLSDVHEDKTRDTVLIKETDDDDDVI